MAEQVTRRQWLIVRPFVVLAIGLAVIVAAWTWRPAEHGSGECPPGAPTADFDLTLQALDGRSLPLASLRGRVVLLNFFASWCAPCRVETPALVDVASAEGPRGLSVVGVMVQDDFVNAAGFAREFRVGYPILDGTTRQDVENAFGPFDGLPVSYLIGRDGRACRKHIGLPPVPAGATDLQAAVRRVLEDEVRGLLGVT